MSAVRHCVAVKRFCVIRMMTGEDIINGEMASRRFVTETKVIKSRC